MQLLTFSRMNAMDRCPRYHYLRYERGVTPREAAEPLRFGSAMHAACEQPDTGDTIIIETYGQRFPYERETCRMLFHGWKHYVGPLQSVAREVQFQFPIVNPQTGMPSRTFSLAGKIDGVVSSPCLAVEEIKTTSEDISPMADYWKRLRRDLQISVYMLAARLAGHDVQTVIYTVMRKPTISPYEATPPDKQKFTKSGELYANQRSRDESPEEWAERLWADIQSRPEYYYARQEIPRLDADLAKVNSEIWNRAKMLREFQLSGNWYRNVASCCPRGAAQCMYHEAVCDMSDERLATDLPPAWTIEEQAHGELNPAAAPANEAAAAVVIASNAEIDREIDKARAVCGTVQAGLEL